MRVLVYVMLLTGSFAAMALKKPACFFGDTGPTPVIYFGGWKSTETQAKAWAASAQASPRYGSKFKFEGNSLHQAPSNKGGVLGASDADINNCVERINSPQFKGPVVLVGHSDGAWVINEIVQRVSKENRAKIKLVNLDGYASKGGAFANVDVQCWTSYMKEKQGTPPKSCKDIIPSAKSLYTDEMAACGSCQFLGESGCGGNWCLHFRTMNKNAPANLGNGNFDSLGYARVEPPLQYLNKFLSATVPVAAKDAKEIPEALK